MGKQLEEGFIDTKKLAKPLEDTWYHAMKAKRGFVCWDGMFNKPIDKLYKISICTTVMNRLSDLQETLIYNMDCNSEYPNLEFAIIDYNSSDDLEDWVRNNMMSHIDTGRLVFYRTADPKYFDMSHSRNLIFKLASGDIVTNIDADAKTPRGVDGECFASYLNRQANQIPEGKAIFAKSRQLLRGRLGFFKKDFLALGGYDEDLKGYGNDDADLMNRAWEMGFTMMSYRGQFCGRVEKHIKHQEGNYQEEWWRTEGKNRMISYTNLITKQFIANRGRDWGKVDSLYKNFSIPMVYNNEGLYDEIRHEDRNLGA